jgi:hypothetical protein
VLIGQLRWKLLTVFAILWHLSSVITYEQIAMWLTSKTLLLFTGGVCTVLGFVGLAIPLMPGFVFFAIAVICFSSASPTLHRKLTAVPKIEQFLAERTRQPSYASWAARYPGRETGRAAAKERTS